MRSVIRAASKLPVKGPTDVEDAMPLHLHFNQKSDYDDGSVELSMKNVFLTLGPGLLTLFQ